MVWYLLMSSMILLAEDFIPLSPAEVEELIDRVRQGLASVRYAAQVIDWTVDEVCMAAFGEVTAVIKLEEIHRPPKKGRPRIEDRAKTNEAKKPWLKLKMSRTTWYRREAEKRSTAFTSTER